MTQFFLDDNVLSFFLVILSNVLKDETNKNMFLHTQKISLELMIDYELLRKSLNVHTPIQENENLSKHYYLQRL